MSMMEPGNWSPMIRETPTKARMISVKTRAQINGARAYFLFHV